MGPYARWRAHAWRIVELAQPDDRLSHAFDVFILTLVFLNVIAVIISSIDTMASRFGAAFDLFELLSVGIFSAEYLARVWSCVEDSRYAHPVLGRLRFMLTPLAIVDLLAVVPSYFAAMNFDLRSLRAVRLARIFRVAKVGRYSTSLRLIGDVFSQRRHELLLSVFLMGMLVTIAASLMYYVEHDAQPGAFPHIPAAMWWAATTLTTVGYGDVYPITPLGRLLGAAIAALGIGMFALPTGIVGAAFAEAMRAQKPPRRTCPHCGREID